MIGSVSTDWQAAARPGARIGHAVEVHHELGSTNDRARELVDEATADGIAVVAEVQSAGRGRRGRSWTSPPGVNLTVSVGLRPGLAAEAAGLLIPAAGLAAHAACASVAEVGLKWPNDVAAPDGRKVGGLLVEVASEGDRLRHAVVGVGLNVNWARADLPDELRATATSLRELAGRPVDRVALLRRLLEALEAEVDELERGRSPIPRYRAACRTLGARVTVQTPTGTLDGRALDVDEGGALVLEADGARVTVTNGEVVRVRAGSGA